MKWPMVKLGDIVDIKGGGTPSKDMPEYWGGDIPWVSVKDFKSSLIDTASDYITAQGLEKSATNLIPRETIVVPTRMAVGKVALLGAEMAINQDLKALIIKNDEKADKRFLLRFLESSANQILKFAKGATVKGITLDVLKDLDVPLPPLEEQKRIAAILDKADAIRRKRQQAIDLADEFLRSVFLDMFGDPVTNPKGWDVELLGEHIQHANNGLSRRRKIEENIGDIVLRLQDVHYESIRFGKELNRIELEDKEKSRYRLDIGDLLFIRVNGNPEYVGRSAVFEGFNEEVFHNDHLIRIKVKDSFNSRFLSYMLNLPGGKKIISSKTKTSAGQHTISQGGIESLEFIVPPIDLQNKFVNIQSTVNKQLNKQSVSFIELTHSFSSLSQKAFAGEL
ncbi:restriction endonuclease subunit S [Marinomonas epiphytica]